MSKLNDIKEYYDSKISMSDIKLKRLSIVFFITFLIQIYAATMKSQFTMDYNLLEEVKSLLGEKFL